MIEGSCLDWEIVIVQRYGAQVLGELLGCPYLPWDGIGGASRQGVEELEAPTWCVLEVFK